jgi:hypothetical protein
LFEQANHPNFDFKYEMGLILYCLLERGHHSVLEGPYRTTYIDEFEKYENYDNGNIILVHIFSEWLNNLLGNIIYVEEYNTRSKCQIHSPLGEIPN